MRLILHRRKSILLSSPLIMWKMFSFFWWCPQVGQTILHCTKILVRMSPKEEEVEGYFFQEWKSGQNRAEESPSATKKSYLLFLFLEIIWWFYYYFFATHTHTPTWNVYLAIKRQVSNNAKSMHGLSAPRLGTTMGIAAPRKKWACIISVCGMGTPPPHILRRCS